MGLKELYEGANNGQFPYVNTVKTNQAADVGAVAGVNFLDGLPRTRSTTAVDQMQTEFSRNAEGALKYGASGRNALTPGASDDVTGTGGLSRWTTSALNIAFDDASTSPSLSSIYNRRKGFKSSSPVNWSGHTNFHQWTPKTGKSFIENLTDADKSKTRVTGAPSGPSPSGLNG